MVTYKQIQEYVRQKFGYTPKTCWIVLAKELSGLTTLWECGRLDLSMEAPVVYPRFEDLFSDEEREVAREHLVAYGWEK